MLIDLDVVPAERERVRATRPVAYVVVAVAALALLLLGGSAVLPRGAGVVEVLKADGTGLSAGLLTTEATYIVRADGQIEATPLCAGCPAWSAQITTGQRLRMGDGGTLVVDENEAGVVTFLDARTGAVLWSRSGFPIVELVGGRVAEWSPDDGMLRLRELRTGRLFWQRPAEAFVGDDKRVVLLDEGRAAVYAADSGRELTGWRDLGVRGELRFFSPGTAAAQIVGERLIVFDAQQVAAFRLDGLQGEWLTPVVSPFGMAACGGGLLCAIGFEGLTVLDPASGKVRWRGPQWRTLAGGRVLTDENGRSARVDVATGRIEHDFGRGRPIDHLLFYPEGNRTTLVGADDGRVRGVIPRVTPDACQTAGDLLSCLRYDLTVTVWRIKP
ncbi:hypothetical protein Aab01nite_39290 [Paractinoplanes abujensis]|uniref:Outer membrane protein assembly factor BamB n=1 Tax=Paractinoplanes abujensis TaxID=882441 RepID=A0A7W7G1R4_9ACTN|nr:PQQ-binding-like beta-propeller repeat protein [Actinoplanes abujensis]MBB4694448.1 outer membrane protein assembly factor BamB [Actinoplanes abujensis]GID20339.1 hypothetical protein Aab01nite_39290 [Actinoplanes abujensis]